MYNSQPTRKWWKIKIDRLSVLFGSISLYIFYTFWFQYSYTEISGMMTILGLLVLISVLINVRGLSFYSLLYPVVFFLGYCFIVNFLKGQSLSIIIQLVQYMLPCFGVYTYCVFSRKRWRRIVWVIAIACFLLSIALIQKGSLSYSGALRIVGLNENTASNYLTFGLMACLMLIRFEKGQRLYRNIFLIVMSVFMIVAQIFCASRRGFIIMLFIIVCYLYSVYRIRLNRKGGQRLQFILLIIIAIVFLFFNYKDRFMSSTIYQRFLGAYDTGDIARRRYQEIAWSLFTSSPVIGKGLGAVASVAGVYSHSLYYELLACTGINGFAVMIGYFIYIIIRLFKNSKTNMQMDNDVAFESFFLLWFAISTLISGIAMVYIYESYFYIMIALLVAYIRIMKTESMSNE